MNKHILSAITALVFALAASAEALGQASASFPGLIVNTSATRSLEKAERLYAAGEFKRAYFIYRNELTPLGDKYSQYMVGYMHLTGQGTDADRVAAAAWYRLAAERGTREFVLVHNQLLVSLAPEQIPEYEQLFLELRREYGDLPLLMQAVRKDFDVLRQRTGSRLGSGASPITIVEMRRRQGFTNADEYYDNVEDRMRGRLELISKYIQTEIDSGDTNAIDLDEIEDLVNQALEKLD